MNNQYDQGNLRMDTWLTKLIWIIAQKSGGELRIDADELESAPNKVSLLTDFDHGKKQIILRACAGTANLIVIDTQQQWARSEKETRSRETYSERSPEPIPVNGRRVNRGLSEIELGEIEASRGHVPTDEFLARIEQGLLQRAANRTEEREQARVTTRRRSMARPVPDTS
jgi:hypothetical protein